MYEGCLAELQMKRAILEDGYFDDGSYECKVVSYHPDKHMIYMVAEDQDVYMFSLDGLYECRIESDGVQCICQGYLRERFINSLGQMLVFETNNGFYKKNIKK